MILIAKNQFYAIIAKERLQMALDALEFVSQIVIIKFK